MTEEWQGTEEDEVFCLAMVCAGVILYEAETNIDKAKGETENSH